SFRIVGRRFDLCVRSGQPLAQNQQDGRAENKYKEEDLIADNRADQRHFTFAGGQPARFAQFMQAGQGQLRGDQPQNNRGRGEKAVQWNLQGALKEEKADGNRRGQAEDGSDPGLEAFAGKLDRAENYSQLNAFAQDHEKNKEGDTPAGG